MIFYYGRQMVDVKIYALPFFMRADYISDKSIVEFARSQAF